MTDDIRRPKRRGSRGTNAFLGPLETAVMERLWKRRQATVREVVDDLTRSRSLAYTTVMTIMTRLHRKGLLTRDRDGKTYVYRPAYTRDEHRAKLARAEEITDELVLPAYSVLDEADRAALVTGLDRIATTLA